MLKLLFLFHRYLGICLGLLMLLWCLSGFVMMYKPYPELTEAQQLATLVPLNAVQCCSGVILPDTNQDIAAAALRSIADIPLLRLYSDSGAWTDYDLRTGKPPDALLPGEAFKLAKAFADRNKLGEPALTGAIAGDQWTVYGSYNPYRPLLHFSANVPQNTQWYLSAGTGDVVQITTGSQRVWGYLGAVIHWLYPTLLRQHVALWSQTVIWLTLASIVLVCTGLYFGLRQYRKRRSGRFSPYTGLSRWHHYSGLLFGILTFTWVFRGLFSMNPWGLLEGEGMQQERRLIRGGDMRMQDLETLFVNLDTARLPNDTRQLEAEKRLGNLHLFAVQADGSRIALNPLTLKEESLNPKTFLKVARALLPTIPVSNVTLLETEDSYYYHHHERVQLPVWRIISADKSRTRYYLNPDNPALLRKIDPEKRWYRWLFYGIHRGDFTRFLRSRPVWDLVLGALMIGVSFTCLTGFLAGLRRLGIWRK